MQPSFAEAIPVLSAIEEAGFEAFFVGGSVRDIILGKPSGDIDIATSALPEEVKSIFPKTVDIGIEHGTILVLYKGKSYEVTTFRTESDYHDFRRPSNVKFVRSLIEDLKRRDFTMNAMALGRDGEIIDPFFGKTHINEKLICTVGEPKERFSEDALRMMRAVRFVSQLAFKVEKRTHAALTVYSPLLENIAVERKKAEFEKLLLGVNKNSAFRLLTETGMYKFLPGLSEGSAALEKLCTMETDRLELNEMWAILLYCLELNSQKNEEEFLRGWRLPIKQLKRIMEISKFLKLRLIQKWDIRSLFLAGREVIMSVEKLYSLTGADPSLITADDWLKMYDSLPIKSGSEIDVTGSDLMNWSNRTGGPWVKAILLEIEQAILEGKLENKKTIIRKWVEACSQK